MLCSKTKSGFKEGVNFSFFLLISSQESDLNHTQSARCNFYSIHIYLLCIYLSTSKDLRPNSLLCFYCFIKDEWYEGVWRRAGIMPWWKNIFCHSSCIRCLSHIAHILSDKRKDKIQSWELEKTKEIEEEHVTVNISHFLSHGRAGASFRALPSMAHTCLQCKPACPAVWRNNPSRVWRRDSRRAQEGEPGVHFNSHTWHLCQEVKQPCISL